MKPSNQHTAVAETTQPTTAQGQPPQEAQPVATTQRQAQAVKPNVGIMAQTTTPTASGAKAKPKNKTPTQKQNPNSAQNALKIAEIRDDIAILEDGSFRGVMMVKSINFDLMSPAERESVEYAYQHFLNSIDFPVQVSVRSRKIDMTGYIEKLEKIRTGHDNMLLNLLMEDYIFYINVLVDEANIMSKEFYVTVPYEKPLDFGKAKEATSGFIDGILNIFKVNKNTERVVIQEADFEKAKVEINNRINSVASGLDQINIRSTRLNTEALIELYYNYYNPDTATYQSLAPMESLEAPYVIKGQGQVKNNARTGV